MSRIAKAAVLVPAGVDVTLSGATVSVKGAGGQLALEINPVVAVTLADGKLNFAAKDSLRESDALAGTMRQMVSNMVVGVSKGFERKLSLVGVGYRAQASGNKLNLAVGYSHPVNIDMPEGVSVATPTPTEIVLKGADRQRIGQIAAEIRAVRPPEPYKGKGIRYVDEKIVIKETKKK